MEVAISSTNSHCITKGESLHYISADATRGNIILCSTSRQTNLPLVKSSTTHLSKILPASKQYGELTLYKEHESAYSFSRKGFIYSTKVEHKQTKSSTISNRETKGIDKSCSCIELIGKTEYVTEFESNQLLCNIHLKFGHLMDPDYVLEKLPIIPLATCNTLIARYTDLGYEKQGLHLFRRMQQEGVQLSRVTFICVLKACSRIQDLQQGREIHALLVESGYEFGSYVGNTLIDMYVKCSSVKDAVHVFHRSPELDVVSYNSLIGGLSELGFFQESICLFNQMHQIDIEPDIVTFICILKAIRSTETYHLGRQIHAMAIEFGFEAHEPVCHCLLHMYSCSENLQDACILFNRLSDKNVVTWSILISGYAHCGHSETALQLYNQMEDEGIKPNQVTFLAVLKACSISTAMVTGTKIHSNIIQCGYENDIYIGNALIDMYGKSGNFVDARTTFHRLHLKNVVTWTSLITGYSQHGLQIEAYQIFERMKGQSLHPNCITLASLLKSFSGKEGLSQGRQLHTYIIEHGLEFDEFIAASLINMYGECCCLNDMIMIFQRLPHRGVVMWNSVIARHSQLGNDIEALQYFDKMLSEGHVEPDTVTYICILKACFNLSTLQLGLHIHADIVKSSFLIDPIVSSALIDVYIRCGCLDDAVRLFNGLPVRNSVTWNTLMGGFAEYEYNQEVLEIFRQMQLGDVTPDTVTCLYTVKACSNMSALQQGQLIHMCICKLGFDREVTVGNALISMYGNCVSLNESQSVFDSMHSPDTVSWSALMEAYVHNDNYWSAVKCYEAMQQSGMKPDNVTFVCLMTACSRDELLDEGCLLLKSMREDWRILPLLEHYNCMVDLLGRIGAFEKVEDLLETIPFEKNLVGWSSLLHASRMHLNLGVGQRCFNNMVTVDRSNAASYVILSNIYSQVGRWKEALIIEELRNVANAWKKPAKAYIEIDGATHEFIVGDTEHENIHEVNAKLESLETELRNEGYEPQSDLVLTDGTDKDKEAVLCGHAEKLAIAFGLISSPFFTTLRVTKNLRMCSDCHVVTKLISKIEKRDIIVKDAYCIHRFQEGSCSCNL